VAPSEVTRKERPAADLARALDGHAVVVLEIADLVGFARLRRNALSVQCQRQSPREIIAGVTLRTVNDQNPCSRHRDVLREQGCEDRARRKPRRPWTSRATAALAA